MFERRHEAMAWIHTWLGLVCSALFFVIFFMGAVTVFRPELDRWMNPSLRHVQPSETLDLDTIAARLDEVARPLTHRAILLPSDRMPAVSVSYFARGRGYQTRYLDPETLEELPKISGGGSWLFDELHNKLFLLPWGPQGRRLVAVVSILALAVMIAGIWIHKGHFRDLFVIRRDGKTGRMLVDLHTALSLIGLPFHFLLSVSGIWIIAAVLLPHGVGSAYESRADYQADAYGNYEAQAAGVEAPMLSLDELRTQAEKAWNGPRTGTVTLRLAGDANAFATFHQRPTARLSELARKRTYSAVTGELLDVEPSRPLTELKGLMDGVHRIAFRSYTIRWLYFFLGLVGSGMIATGLLFWLEKRRETGGTVFQAAIAGMTAGTVLGVPIGTVTTLVVNRVLPAVVSPRRELAEALAFFAMVGLVTATSTLFAFLRRGALPWTGLTAGLGALSLAAAVLNWITTGDHLLSTPVVGAVLGTDLVLLTVAAASAAWVVRQRLRAHSP